MLKSLILKAVPDRVLFATRKWRYPRAMRAFAVPHRKILRVLIRPGDYVLDLGAHAGWYTKILSELVEASGRVYSVEPVPPTFDLLAFCVRKLRLNNVQLINCAVSDHSGLALMEIPPYGVGGNNFYQAHIVGSDEPASHSQTFRVARQSVDALFLGLARPVAFIKADVEGHELAVITGARGVIRRSRPALFLEVTSDPDDPASEAHRLSTYLEHEGYQPYWVDGECLIQRQRGHWSVNYFFLTRGHLASCAHANIPVRGASTDNQRMTSPEADCEGDTAR